MQNVESNHMKYTIVDVIKYLNRFLVILKKLIQQTKIISHVKIEKIFCNIINSICGIHT